MDANAAAEKITEWIYKQYGSETGFLMGIAPRSRVSVESIVRLALQYKGLHIEAGEVSFR